MPGTKEYNAWANMKTRCYNPNYYLFHRYGGRGIFVCERWQNFECFLADMGPAPSPGHSIDRIDTEKGYGPDNCRWASALEQANNRSNNLVLEHRGIALTLADWSRKTGISYSVLQRRLDNGWSVSESLETPVNASRYIYKTPDGVFSNQYDVAEAYGLKLKTVSARFCSKTFDSWTKEKLRKDCDNDELDTKRPP